VDYGVVAVPTILFFREAIPWSDHGAWSQANSSIT